MPSHFSVRFMRVGEHLINFEAIQQVTLKKDDSAVVTLNGPRKGLQQIRVAKPYGRELWSFVHDNLAVVDFGESDLSEPPAGAQPEQQPSKKRKKKRARADS